jgi:hypothetical protein
MTRANDGAQQPEAESTRPQRVAMRKQPLRPADLPPEVLLALREQALRGEARLSEWPPEVLAHCLALQREHRHWAISYQAPGLLRLADKADGPPRHVAWMPFGPNPLYLAWMPVGPSPAPCLSARDPETLSELIAAKETESPSARQD